MKRPLVFICLFLILGILAANYVSLPFLIVFILLILSLGTTIIFLRHNFLFPFFLALTSIFLGACLLTNANILSKDHIGRFTPYKGKQVMLKGVIIDEPAQKKYKQSFTLQAAELDDRNGGQKVTGKVLVWCFKKADFRYGQEVILEGKLYRPYPLRLSGRFNYRDYLKRKGIYAMLSVSKKGKVIFTGNNQGNFVKKSAFSLKNKVKQLIASNLSPEAAGILSAMILGARGDVPQFFNKALQRTGTVHVLAVSGLHVGIVVLVIMVLMKIIHVPHKLSYVLAVFILIFYCLLSGGRTSVVRATIMACILLVGFLIERDYEPASGLSLAACIILWHNPFQIFDIGFQLSFFSVISIIYLSPKMIRIIPQVWSDKKWFKVVIITFCVSLAAWLGTLGLIAYYFNMLTPIAVLANMIIVPFIFIIVAGGFIFILLGTLIPPLAHSLAVSCEFLITILYKINSLFLLVPGAYFELPRVSLSLVIGYYFIILLVFNIDLIKYNLLIRLTETNKDPKN